MDESEKFWDKQARSFAKKEDDIQLVKNKDFETTLRYININDIVMDYGCGGGIVSIGISDKVKKVYAIDVSSKMIETAKANAAELSLSVSSLVTRDLNLVSSALPEI